MTSVFRTGDPNQGYDLFRSFADGDDENAGTLLSADEMNHLQSALFNCETEILERFGRMSQGLRYLAGDTENHFFKILGALKVAGNPPETARLFAGGMLPYQDGTYSYILVPVTWKIRRGSSPTVTGSVSVLLDGASQAGWAFFTENVDGIGGMLGARKTGVIPNTAYTSGGFYLDMTYEAE